MAVPPRDEPNVNEIIKLLFKAGRQWGQAGVAGLHVNQLPGRAAARVPPLSPHCDAPGVGLAPALPLPQQGSAQHCWCGTQQPGWVGWCDEDKSTQGVTECKRSSSVGWNGSFGSSLLPCGVESGGEQGNGIALWLSSPPREAVLVLQSCPGHSRSSKVTMSQGKQQGGMSFPPVSVLVRNGKVNPVQNHLQHEV